MRVSGLFVYPIKSCRGMSLPAAAVLDTGLRHDRRWMLVNAQGRFVTQREQPRMALIEPVLTAPDEEHSGLLVSAPGMSELLITAEQQGALREVTVWNDQVSGIDEGDIAAEWFSEYLGLSVRLVRFNDAQPRWSDAHWTGAVRAPQRFADGFAMLLISQASLDDLNQRLQVGLPMNRFRPNLVVTGLPAYGEEVLRDFGNSELQLRGVKPCTRCKITTTDQATGLVIGPEPLSTLMSYRRHAELRGVTFGQNVIVVRGAGARLHVGQALAVPA